MFTAKSGDVPLLNSRLMLIKLCTSSKDQTKNQPKYWEISWDKSKIHIAYFSIWTKNLEIKKGYKYNCIPSFFKKKETGIQK